MPRRFDPDVLKTLEQVEEVQIEPRPPEGGEGRRTTIWVVVVDRDVYVRSYRGPGGRWYQQITAHPEAILHAGDLHRPVRAVPVTDPGTIQRVSEAYRRKYEQEWPEDTADMLRDEVLLTTLRLEPS